MVPQNYSGEDNEEIQLSISFPSSDHVNVGAQIRANIVELLESLILFFTGELNEKIVQQTNAYTKL